MSRTPLPPADFGKDFPDASYTPTQKGYTKQEKFRFWCQTVLPLVYDDSLSYYELLNKVVDYMNHSITDMRNIISTLFDQLKPTVDEWIREHPEYVTTVMDGAITSKKFNVKLDKAIFHNAFYDLSDYDILPEAGDIYDKMFDFLHGDGINGGVFYLPEGYYELSDTIFLPENSVLCGDGAKTILYYTGEYTYYGTGVACGGDNVTIKNIKINHRETEDFYTTMHAALGGIGFSTISFESWFYKHQNQQFIRENRKNLVAENIYSDSNYILQTETNNEFHISNVRYENIYAPNSCVSISPKGDDGFISDVIVRNVVCGLFRNGTGIRNTRNVYCENIHTSEMYTPDPVTVINFTVNSEFTDMWQWHSSRFLFADNSSFYNGTIADNERYRFTIGNYCVTGNTLLYNIKTNDITGKWRNASETDTPITFLFCDFGGGAIPNLSNVITFGTKANFPRSLISKNYENLLTLKSDYTITHEGNSILSNLYYPTMLKVAGNTVKISVALNLVNYEPVFSIPAFLVTENTIIQGTLANISEGQVTETTPCYLKCDSNGNFTIIERYFNPENYNTIFIADSYCIY